MTAIIGSSAAVSNEGLGTIGDSNEKAVENSENSTENGIDLRKIVSANLDNLSSMLGSAVAWAGGMTSLVIETDLSLLSARKAVDAFSRVI